MKCFYPILSVFITILVFSSCQNKTQDLLNKKWDCIRVENILPQNNQPLNAQDSANFVQLQHVLQTIVWKFNSNYTYECSVNNLVTVEGRYRLQNSNSTLICSPSTKQSVNIYTIRKLTENELVLSSTQKTPPLVLHFKPQ